MSREETITNLENLMALAELLRIVHEYVAFSEEPECLIQRSIFLLGLYRIHSEQHLTEAEQHLNGWLRRDRERR